MELAHVFRALLPITRKTTRYQNPLPHFLLPLAIPPINFDLQIAEFDGVDGSDTVHTHPRVTIHLQIVVTSDTELASTKQKLDLVSA